MTTPAKRTTGGTSGAARSRATAARDLARVAAPAPAACLLSNGRYTTLLAGSGSGVSTCGNYTLTAWSADRTEDADGFFVYLRDLDRGSIWSAGRQPISLRAADYAASYADGCARIERSDDGIHCSLEVCVSPIDDIELRRLRLRNDSNSPRRIEVTSFPEVVLFPAAAHSAHPAFSKLFVQTEYAAEQQALLAWRRPRSRDEQHPWLIHVLHGDGPLQYETDRVRFLGRGRSHANPRAVESTSPLSGTTGSVLDPILSLRRTVHLEPGASTELTLLLGAAAGRDTALHLAASYATAASVDAAFAAASERERMLLKRLGITASQAAIYQAIGAGMRYASPVLRAPREVLQRAAGGIDTLWGHGIGDGLVAALRIEQADDLDTLRQLLRANAYWREEGLAVKLALVCAPPLIESVQAAIGDAQSTSTVDAALLNASDMPADHTDLLLARADFVAASPKLIPATKATRRSARKTAPTFRPAPSEVDPALKARTADDSLRSPNGFGGFSADGSEYVINIDPGLPATCGRPPMPWINVIANPHCGFLVSESGAANTWCRNSRENRTTPWYNDPVSDPHGEALYIRDEQAGVFWSPLPGPVPAAARYEVRHGFGYTTWRHTSFELEQQVTAFVPQQTPDPLKIVRVQLRNTSDRRRRLSLYSYSRLVLGVAPDGSGRFIVTDADPSTDTVLARNRTNFEFRDGVTFAAAVTPAKAKTYLSTDRSAFLGCEGSPSAPAALLSAKPLDGTVGAGLDACIAIQVVVDLAPNASVDCAFLLGEGDDAAQVAQLVAKYRQPGAIDAALGQARQFWQALVSKVRVETPLPELDLMVNGWLAYQALSCRIWGRSAFYQSGGAFGFRDQLQDAAALVHLQPSLTREQILLHARHQFPEGDVLHWWHPPTGRGIRTRFSDDLLWLPLLTAFYIHTTGDWSVLDERVGFVTTRALEPGEDEAYLHPGRTEEQADIYDHCCRALDRGLTTGAHGLPLMGTGDWNDGMNRVGREGRGESVWVAFFLYRIIDAFAPVCEQRGDQERLQRYRAYQTKLQAALESAAWDGAWYRRAYYDDGTPLGSAANSECRIDALAQSWAVLSKAVPAPRARQAMDSANHLLIARDDGIIRLLTPPFDRDAHDPGYIKGYVPGIRENGGQYTHGALWVVQAVAELRRRGDAAELLAMLSPVRHAANRTRTEVYQTEPYVVVADVYGTPPHIGRGGWSWYTGAAGWMLRVALESVLGVHIEAGNTLIVNPCVPDDWPGFRATLRLDDGVTVYEVSVQNPTSCTAAVVAAQMDGTAVNVDAAGARIPLHKDGATHRVDVRLGAAVG